MTKPVLYMVLGAVCSNAWWGYAVTKHPLLGFMVAISSLAMLIAVISESRDAQKGRSLDIAALCGIIPDNAFLGSSS